MNRSEAIIAFNDTLAYDGPPLPPGVAVMNPFLENPAVPELSRRFYQRFYADERPRKLILGINPGRLGAGATGIPFTDTKRYAEAMGERAGIGKDTHEPSSVFVHEVIAAYGGAERFFADCYIHSVCPLGFTYTPPGKQALNYNYYDDPALAAAVTPFIIWNLRRQIELAGTRDVCFCLGTGKNHEYLAKLNAKHHFFGRIVALAHPRYVMQYQAKRKQAFIDEWLLALKA